MPQYVILQHHPPNNCPMSSKAARSWAKKQFALMDGLAKELKIKFVIPYLHLDPAHKALMVLEAPSAEAVRDFIIRGGFLHFLDNDLYLATPVAEIMKHAEDIPTIFD